MPQKKHLGRWDWRMQREEKERKKGKTGEVKSTPDKNTDEGTRDIFLLIPMSMKKII